MQRSLKDINGPLFQNNEHRSVQAENDIDNDLLAIRNQKIRVSKNAKMKSCFSYVTICLSTLLMSACHLEGKDAAQKLTGHIATTDSKSPPPDSIDAQSEYAHTLKQKDTAEEWLRNIFKTKNSDKFFPDDNVEQRLCTKRFYAFILDSGEIYGPSNFMDEEYSVAEKKYKDKWSDIYPMEEREMWLFGRGNGDIGELKQLKISKVKEQIYHVFIDYGNDIKTKNEVTIVTENGVYKIDYCKTEFVK